MVRKTLLIFILVALAVFITKSVFAAGTIALQEKRIGPNTVYVRLLITNDASGNPPAATSLDTIYTAGVGSLYGLTTYLRDNNFFWYLAVTNPGSTAPAALWDITMVDARGVDVANSLLLNRSATLDETVKITPTRFVTGAQYLTVANTTNANATAVLELYYVN